MTDIHYIPDGWVLCKYKNNYKVFCSWSGGYLHGDSWRLHSKVRTVHRDDDANYIINKDGTSYQLNPHAYGRISVYNRVELSGFEEKGLEVLEESEGILTLELLTDLTREATVSVID